MTIYLDIIFLENLSMNYIILFATGLITKNKVNHFRLIISGIFGGTYAIISIMPIFKVYTTIIFKILISILMVYIAYNPKSFKDLSKKLMIFYLTSFAFGGCAFALLYFIKPQEVFMKNGVYIGKYPIKITLLGGLAGFCLIVNAFKIIKNKINKKDIYCPIEIEFNNKCIEMKALIDTGNMLKDPITSMPVIVVQKDLLKELLPENILENLDNIIGGGNLNVFNIIENTEYVNKFRLIPFASLGVQHGILLGFKPDNVKIYYNEELKKIKNVIIGIYDKRLNKNHSYSAILGLDTLLEEEFDYEYIKYDKN